MQETHAREAVGIKRRMFFLDNDEKNERKFYPSNLQSKTTGCFRAIRTRVKVGENMSFELADPRRGLLVLHAFDGKNGLLFTDNKTAVVSVNAERITFLA